MTARTDQEGPGLFSQYLLPGTRIFSGQPEDDHMSSEDSDVITRCFYCKISQWLLKNVIAGGEVLGYSFTFLFTFN